MAGNGMYKMSFFVSVDELAVDNQYHFYENVRNIFSRYCAEYSGIFRIRAREDLIWELELGVHKLI